MSRVAIVTGANRGIGLAIVKKLCEEFSGDVLLTARNIENGEKALDEVKHQGYHNAVFHELDVTSKPSIEKFRTFVKDKYGGLDILVNNAGIAYGRNTTVPFPEQAQETIKVNFTAVLNVSDALFPLLRPHGRVVNMGSSLGHLAVLSSDLQAKLSSDDLAVDQLISLMSQFVR
jgi:NAD(P)-dependent dehydrogenase (short-subunit alcohol dehydrogenase family)